LAKTYLPQLSPFAKNLPQLCLFFGKNLPTTAMSICQKPITATSICQKPTYHSYVYLPVCSQSGYHPWEDEDNEVDHP